MKTLDLKIAWIIVLYAVTSKVASSSSRGCGHKKTEVSKLETGNDGDLSNTARVINLRNIIDLNNGKKKTDVNNVEKKAVSNNGNVKYTVHRTKNNSYEFNIPGDNINEKYEEYDCTFDPSTKSFVFNIPGLDLPSITTDSEHGKDIFNLQYDSYSNLDDVRDIVVNVDEDQDIDGKTRYVFKIPSKIKGPNEIFKPTNEVYGNLGSSVVPSPCNNYEGKQRIYKANPTQVIYLDYDNAMTMINDDRVPGKCYKNDYNTSVFKTPFFDNESNEVDNSKNINSKIICENVNEIIENDLVKVKNSESATTHDPIKGQYEFVVPQVDLSCRTTPINSLDMHEGGTKSSSNQVHIIFPEGIDTSHDEIPLKTKLIEDPNNLIVEDLRTNHKILLSDDDIFKHIVKDDVKVTKDTYGCKNDKHYNILEPVVLESNKNGYVFYDKLPENIRTIQQNPVTVADNNKNDIINDICECTAKFSKPRDDDNVMIFTPNPCDCDANQIVFDLTNNEMIPKQKVVQLIEPSKTFDCYSNRAVPKLQPKINKNIFIETVNPDVETLYTKNPYLDRNDFIADSRLDNPSSTMKCPCVEKSFLPDLEVIPALIDLTEINTNKICTKGDNIVVDTAITVLPNENTVGKSQFEIEIPCVPVENPKLWYALSKNLKNVVPTEIIEPLELPKLKELAPVIPKFSNGIEFVRNKSPISWGSKISPLNTDPFSIYGAIPDIAHSAVNKPNNIPSLKDIPIKNLLKPYKDIQLSQRKPLLPCNTVAPPTIIPEPNPSALLENSSNLIVKSIPMNKISYIAPSLTKPVLNSPNNGVKLNSIIPSNAVPLSLPILPTLNLYKGKFTPTRLAPIPAVSLIKSPPTADGNHYLSPFKTFSQNPTKAYFSDTPLSQTSITNPLIPNSKASLVSPSCYTIPDTSSVTPSSTTANNLLFPSHPCMTQDMPPSYVPTTTKPIEYVTMSPAKPFSTPVNLSKTKLPAMKTLPVESIPSYVTSPLSIPQKSIDFSSKACPANAIFFSANPCKADHFPAKSTTVPDIEIVKSFDLIPCTDTTKSASPAKCKVNYKPYTANKMYTTPFNLRPTSLSSYSAIAPTFTQPCFHPKSFSADPYSVLKPIPFNPFSAPTATPLLTPYLAPSLTSPVCLNVATPTSFRPYSNLTPTTPSLLSTPIPFIPYSVTRTPITSYSVALISSNPCPLTSTPAQSYHAQIVEPVTPNSISVPSIFVPKSLSSCSATTTPLNPCDFSSLTSQTPISTLTPILPKPISVQTRPTLYNLKSNPTHIPCSPKYSVSSPVLLNPISEPSLTSPIFRFGSKRTVLKPCPANITPTLLNSISTPKYPCSVLKSTPFIPCAKPISNPFKFRSLPTLTILPLSPVPESTSPSPGFMPTFTPSIFNPIVSSAPLTTNLTPAPLNPYSVLANTPITSYSIPWPALSTPSYISKPTLLKLYFVPSLNTLAHFPASTPPRLTPFSILPPTSPTLLTPSSISPLPTTPKHYYVPTPLLPFSNSLRIPTFTNPGSIFKPALLTPCSKLTPIKSNPLVAPTSSSSYSIPTSNSFKPFSTPTLNPPIFSTVLTPTSNSQIFPQDGLVSTSPPPSSITYPSISDPITSFSLALPTSIGTDPSLATNPLSNSLTLLNRSSCKNKTPARSYPNVFQIFPDPISVPISLSPLSSYTGIKSSPTLQIKSDVPSNLNPNLNPITSNYLYAMPVIANASSWIKKKPNWITFNFPSTSPGKIYPLKNAVSARPWREPVSPSSVSDVINTPSVVWKKPVPKSNPCVYERPIFPKFYPSLIQANKNPGLNSAFKSPPILQSSPISYYPNNKPILSQPLMPLSLRNTISPSSIPVSKTLSSTSKIITPIQQVLCLKPKTFSSPSLTMNLKSKPVYSPPKDKINTVLPLTMNTRPVDTFPCKSPKASLSVSNPCKSYFESPSPTLNYSPLKNTPYESSITPLNSNAVLKSPFLRFNAFNPFSPVRPTAVSPLTVDPKVLSNAVTPVPNTDPKNSVTYNTPELPLFSPTKSFRPDPSFPIFPCKPIFTPKPFYMKPVSNIVKHSQVLYPFKTADLSFTISIPISKKFAGSPLTKPSTNNYCRLNQNKPCDYIPKSTISNAFTSYPIENIEPISLPMKPNVLKFSPFPTPVEYTLDTSAFKPLDSIPSSTSTVFNVMPCKPNNNIVNTLSTLPLVSNTRLFKTNKPQLALKTPALLSNSFNSPVFSITPKKYIPLQPFYRTSLPTTSAIPTSVTYMAPPNTAKYLAKNMVQNYRPLKTTFSNSMVYLGPSFGKATSQFSPAPNLPPVAILRNPKTIPYSTTTPVSSGMALTTPNALSWEQLPVPTNLSLIPKSYGLVLPSSNRRFIPNTGTYSTGNIIQSPFISIPSTNPSPIPNIYNSVKNPLLTSNVQITDLFRLPFSKAPVQPFKTTTVPASYTNLGLPILFSQSFPEYRPTSNVYSNLPLPVSYSNDASPIPKPVSTLKNIPIETTPLPPLPIPNKSITKLVSTLPVSFIYKSSIPSSYTQTPSPSISKPLALLPPLYTSNISNKSKPSSFSNQYASSTPLLSNVYPDLASIAGIIKPNIPMSVRPLSSYINYPESTRVNKNSFIIKDIPTFDEHNMYLPNKPSDTNVLTNNVDTKTITLPKNICKPIQNHGSNCKYLSNVLKTNINKILTPESLKTFDNLDNLTIPLNDIGIIKYIPDKYSEFRSTNHPGIELKTWPSKIKILKPKLILEATEFNIVNFVPIVRHNKFDLDVVQDIARRAVENNYGVPIVLKGKYDDLNSFAVLDNIGRQRSEKCLVLWPTYYDSKTTF